MTPIIDPMLFYWIDVIVNLGFVFSIVSFILFIAFIYGCFCLWNGEFGLFSPKLLVILFVIWSVVSTIKVFIPSESTIYKMVLAKNITPDNIEVVQGELTELVDYIIDKVDELND